MRVGDEVTIRKDIYTHKLYEGESVIVDMLPYRGQQATVLRELTNGKLKISADKGQWFWTREMLFETDLQQMINKQRKLQNRLGYNFETMNYAERTAFIKEHSIHATQELHEMLYELPFFKGWKDYSTMSTEDIEEQFNKAKEEYIDMVHFVLNIAIGLGMTAEEIHRLYIDKNKENHRRQDEGYAYEKEVGDC